MCWAIYFLSRLSRDFIFCLVTNLPKDLFFTRETSTEIMNNRTVGMFIALENLGHKKTSAKGG